ncbi:MAG: hypothetical protein ACLSCR_05380 [Akkermansia sp.]
MPAPFKVTAVPQQANGESYTTLAVRTGKDFIAALIPYRVFKNGAVTYHLGGKETPPLQVWAQEKLTGLTLFKVNPALLSGTSLPSPQVLPSDGAPGLPSPTAKMNPHWAFTWAWNTP